MDISEKAFKELVVGVRNFLENIILRSKPHERMETSLKESGKGRKEPKFNCSVGIFTSGQLQVVLDTLVDMLGISFEIGKGLMMNVLFPETLIRIYMDRCDIKYKLCFKRLELK